MQRSIMKATIHNEGNRHNEHNFIPLTPLLHQGDQINLHQQPHRQDDESVGTSHPELSLMPS